MNEAQIQAEIMLRVGSLHGVRLFRNSVGEGWVGRTIRHEGSRLLLEHPRRVTFGWCPGSSDLLGYRSREITPDMVGQTVAQLVAIEVKGPRGRATMEQARFIEVVRRHGATAGVARSVDEALATLGLVQA
ncbi:VRR-NUC domain-containing protein [Komagataeibacter diospyri]|uniref:VRR-NUC domain-containing protein n=1 Tax=Komagataeibacter diospyri TaxID=1932662 RepID=A0A4P5NU28_9PROT|nr:VRR-NUC domain-containing protein [Komagataeibacter diospyri]GCE85139.1 hypothetical protein MSKU9_3280 [Komagataeibacter diospyri]